MVTPVAVSHRIRNVLLAGFTIIVAVISYLLSVLFLPPTSFPVKSYVDIPEGSTLYQVADILHEQGIISSPFVFREYFRFFKSDKFVSAGKYYFDTRLCLISVADRMSSADFQIPRFKILIPEGSDVKEISEAIKNQIPTFDAGKFIALASGEEGYLFPDTYRFAKGSGELQIYRLAYTAMMKRLSEQWAKRDPALPYKTPYEALIMASIVEKETGQKSERGLIAGVFVNRLRIGMLLQTDPTVIYGMGERYQGNIRKRDLLTDTPYNTYTRGGLPPTPIALAGAQSLAAVMNPASTNALYFVSRNDGTSQFSASLAEHNNAVNQYQRQGRNK